MVYFQKKKSWRVISLIINMLNLPWSWKKARVTSNSISVSTATVMSLASVVPTQVQWTRKQKRWNCAINQLQSSSQGLCSLHLSSVKQCSEWKVENNIEVRGRGINFPGLKFRDQTNLVHRLTLLCLCRSVYKIGTKSNVKETPCLLKTLWSQRFPLFTITALFARPRRLMG